MTSILVYLPWKKGHFYTNLMKSNFLNHKKRIRFNIYLYFSLENLPHSWSIGGFEDVPYLAFAHKNIIYIYNLLNLKKNKYVNYKKN